ncbi:MAG TPA: hypothetical protein VFR70_09615 [Flavobacterium sp.]|nr:hypothetical protein [Flavobacterium sp.]
MKIISFCLRFFLSSICKSQEVFDPYKEAFNKYMSEYILDHNVPSDATIYLIEKEVITSNIPLKIHLNNKYYNIKLISPKEIKKSRIDFVFEIMPIRNSTDKLYIDIILSAVEIHKGKLFLVNSGGGRYLVNFNCEYKNYTLIRESLE